MEMTRNRLLLIIVCVLVLLAFVPQASSLTGAPSIERRLTEVMKEIYKDRDDVHIKVEKLPLQLREGAKIQGIDIVKIPEGRGRGLALVEYRGADSKIKSSYVAFRTFDRKSLFYAKRNMKKGEPLDRTDVDAREAYVGEKAYFYPETLGDLKGKILKKDISAGTVITNVLLDEPEAIKRGQTVTIVAQNKRLVVQTTGKATQGGRRGDLIKVKNIHSDRELQGRIVDNRTVTIDF